jgi:predicted HicB family RNase H-like nuclease
VTTATTAPRRLVARADVRLPADLHDAAQARAASPGLSLSSLIRLALSALLARDGPRWTP